MAGARSIEKAAARKWSPEQIAGWLKRTYPKEVDKQVSHALPVRVLRSNVPRGRRYIEAFIYRPVACLRRGFWNIFGPNARYADQNTPVLNAMDWGKELADHTRLALATDVDVYFCDPRSPWQRGSNENTNRLLRQYLPRGTDVSAHSQAKLSAIARQLNERPRKTLQYQTPAEMFAQCVASTR